MINDLYPSRFKEWEFLMTPNNFWTKEKALEALKWTIEEKKINTRTNTGCIQYKVAKDSQISVSMSINVGK